MLMDPNKYTVYVHTNKTNGKKYVGITRQKPERRWQNGHGYENTYFWNAIKKYGWDGFTHEIIGNGLSKEDACRFEVALIALYKTNDRECGYNVSEGGEACDCIKGKLGEMHPNHQRVKMIDKKTGEILRVFGAQSEAARIMGISRKGITKACRGESATYKGYVWEYADKEYKKKEHPGVGNYKHNKIQKKIRLTDIDGKVYEYESIKKAGESLGIRPNTIARYLSGIRCDSSGRRWCYA